MGKYKYGLGMSDTIKGHTHLVTLVQLAVQSDDEGRLYRRLPCGYGLFIGRPAISRLVCQSSSGYGP